MKQLIVEGKTEQLLIPELIEQNGVLWEESPKEYIVSIRDCGGLDEILKKGKLSTFSKASGNSHMGIIIDADDSINEGVFTNWLKLKDCLHREIGHVLPDAPSIEGYIDREQNTFSVGVWMMPNNIDRGMLETFLIAIASEKPDLKEFARTATEEALKHQAGYKNVHFDKAWIHAILAWCDEPGQSLHTAVKTRTLSAVSEEAQAFVSWFITLFELKVK